MAALLEAKQKGSCVFIAFAGHKDPLISARNVQLRLAALPRELGRFLPDGVLPVGR